MLFPIVRVVQRQRCCKRGSGDGQRLSLFDYGTNNRKILSVTFFSRPSFFLTMKPNKKTYLDSNYVKFGRSMSDDLEPDLIMLNCFFELTCNYPIGLGYARYASDVIFISMFVHHICMRLIQTTFRCCYICCSCFCCCCICCCCCCCSCCFCCCCICCCCFCCCCCCY